MANKDNSKRRYIFDMEPTIPAEAAVLKMIAVVPRSAKQAFIRNLIILGHEVSKQKAESDFQR